MSTNTGICCKVFSSLQLLCVIAVDDFVLVLYQNIGFCELVST